LAQVRPDVDQVPSQSRKADKIASSDVARSRVNWANITTSKAMCRAKISGVTK
jgi:hypothetical protein